MDQNRIRLHELLKSVSGLNHVYFQPPATIKLSYPCIIYKRDSSYEERANNSLYLKKKRYQVTIIDRDPDSVIPDKVSKLPLCTFSRFFVSDNLNHDIYNIYF